MSSKSTVLLSVREAGTPAVRCYAFTILIDGQILDQRSLTPVESHELSGIIGQYQMLFDKSCKPKTPANYLETLGSGLFHIFFENVWGQIRPQASDDKVLLVIASDISDVLNLPWEILNPPNGYLLGYDQNFCILRLPELQISLPHFEDLLPLGPLRVVFAACAPRQSFDYSGEEVAFANALDGLDLAWDSCDMGTFEELRKRVDSFRPQIVHLVGQGAMKDGSNCFAFEGKNGTAELKSAAEILKAIPGLQCLFLNGCQNKDPILYNLGQDLVRSGLPMAVAWSGSVLDRESAIRAFYRDLASGRTTDISLTSMRQEIQAVYKRDAAFLAFPSLYCKTSQDKVFDPHQPPISLQPARMGQPLLPGTAEGYAQDFVGRRRDLQRLVPAIRDGTIKTVVITGPLGSGKSALAVRLTRELEAEGLSIIPLYSSKERPLSAARIMETFGSAFQQAAVHYQNLTQNEKAEMLQSAAKALRNPRSSVEERFKEALAALNLSQFLLVLDSFEASLDESDRIKDPDVAGFYRQLLIDLDSSRAVITCERLPVDAMTLPKKAWEHPLVGLTKADFLRFLLRDGAIAGLLRSGHLTHQMLLSLYETTGGLPLCLDRIAKDIGKDSIASSETTSLAVEPSLRGFCNDLSARLYRSLSPAAQAALIRAAVYAAPINAAGLQAVAGERQNVLIFPIEEWTDRALAFQAPGGLLAIRKELRAWLVEKLTLEDLKKANKAAGDFLHDTIKGAQDLGLTKLDCALEARAHYLAADEDERAEDATAQISGILMKRGLYIEVQRQNLELLEHVEHPKPIRWIARAFLEQRDFQKAQEWYLRCLQFPGRSHEDAAESWYGIASANLGQDRYDQAKENFQRALEAYRHIENEAGQTAALLGLASSQMAKGEREHARKTLQNALEIQRKMGDLRGQAETMQHLIAIELRLKNHAAAREKLLELVDIFRKLNHPAGEAAALYDLASLDLEKEDFSSAGEEFLGALSIRQQIGDRPGEAAALHSLALVDVQKGDVNAAKDKFKKALQIYQEIKDKPGEAAALFQLGALAVQLDHIAEGLRIMALSAMILRSVNCQEVRNVEPVVERLASRMKYTQDQFVKMVQEANIGYHKDKGWGLVESALGSINLKK